MARQLEPVEQTGYFSLIHEVFGGVLMFGLEALMARVALAVWTRLEKTEQFGTSSVFAHWCLVKYRFILY